MGINLATFALNATTEGARNAEYAGTPFTDVPGDGSYADPKLGCNQAAACAPGIGINTGDVDPKLSDWSVLDQDGAPREPQFSQHIGGNGLGDGSQTGAPTLVVVARGTNENDQASFSVADTAAAPDAVYDTGSGAVNKTGATVAIGDRIWGPIPVA